MTNTDEIRAQLRAEPYTDLPSWSESLNLAGPRYVDDLTDEMVVKIKARLDALLAGEAVVKRGSFYDDDLVDVGLDDFSRAVVRAPEESE